MDDWIGEDGFKEPEEAEIEEPEGKKWTQNKVKLKKVVSGVRRKRIIMTLLERTKKRKRLNGRNLKREVKWWDSKGSRGGMDKYSSSSFMCLSI